MSEMVDLLGALQRSIERARADADRRRAARDTSTTDPAPSTAMTENNDRVLIRLAPGPGRDPADVEQDLVAQLEYGIAVTREHLLAGRPGRALYELTRSVQAQAKIAGLGTLPIATALPPARHKAVGR